MRKLFTIIVLLLSVISVSAQQRFINLEVSVLNLANIDTIPPMQIFPVQITIKNLGTDTLRHSDSIALYTIYGNDTLWMVNNGQFSRYTTYTDYLLPSGDSMTIPKTMAFDVSYLNRSANLCFYAIPFNHDPDSINLITDSDLTNNSGCMRVTVRNNPPSGVEEKAAYQESVSVFPNPVTTEANFSVKLNTSNNIIISIFDIIGRLVKIEERQGLVKGAHIIKMSTENIKSGVYLYQVLIGKEKISGKLLIN